jgi:hypothetical protein
VEHGPLEALPETLQLGQHHAEVANPEWKVMKRLETGDKSHAEVGTVGKSHTDVGNWV